MNLLVTYVGYSRGTWRNLSCHIWFACFLFPFFCDDLMYQSVPSLTIPPGQNPGNFFDGQIPHPWAKRDPNPHPRAYKNELKPHHQGQNAPGGGDLARPQLFKIKT